MAGIDRTSGHMGASQATRMRGNLSAVGQATFSLGSAVASGAAGVAGGPIAGQAVSSALDITRSAVSGGSGGAGGAGGAFGGLRDQVEQGTESISSKGADSLSKAQDQQMELFMLQQSVNAQSQTFNTMTNVQKSKHDAAMAAIQNTR